MAGEWKNEKKKLESSFYFEMGWEGIRHLIQQPLLNAASHALFGSQTGVAILDFFKNQSERVIKK